MIARGSEFEAEIAKILRSAGFEVTPNAKAARPRQTDIFAREGSFDFLIEAKNRKHKIDVSDVDALRSRLNRTSSDVVGAIFTTSGITRGAIKLIESERQREVLVFVKEEVEGLRRGTQNVRTLIDRKRNELRVHGKAWFGPTLRSEFLTVGLPSGNIEFQIGHEVTPYFESKSSLSGAYYTLEMPDSGWGSFGGEGARLSIRLPLSTASDLRNILGYLHEKFGFSKNGIFSIHQSESSWYGVGAENFVCAVDAWRDRYAQSRSNKFHHSEAFSYFDHFRNGWLELSSQQRNFWNSESAPRASFFTHSELVIQLPGVPIDASPFLKLCQYVGDAWACFEFIGRRQGGARRLKGSRRLQVVGRVIEKSDGEKNVIGVIAKNPYYRRTSFPKELSDFDAGALQELSETELLLCSLSDWHDHDDVVDYYTLMGFEITVGGVAYIIRPFGTWNRLLKRRQRPPSSVASRTARS